MSKERATNEKQFIRARKPAKPRGCNTQHVSEQSWKRAKMARSVGGRRIQDLHEALKPSSSQPPGPN